MDPQSYQQAMIQQLMGAQSAAPGTTGQIASTPYGASFQTGNMGMPQFMAQAGQQGQQGQQSASGQYPGMLGTNAATQLQQPMATYG